MKLEELKELTSEAAAASKDMAAAWEKFGPEEKKAARVLIHALVLSLPDEICNELNDAIVARAEIKGATT